jgi:two-component system, chemotaxis family, protein-glutamate methylesterase/glutaminase
MAVRLIVIGTSLGGFHALKTVLADMPPDFPLPVVVVQHRSFDEPDLLAPLLAEHLRMPVVEAEDKLELKEGQIFVGPSNYHLLIDDGHLALSTDAPVLRARPSIDVLFESAAEGFTVVQDPITAEGRIMPEAAIESAVADKILPLEKIASFLMDLSVGQRMKA